MKHDSPAVALVTGGARRIGATLVEQLHQHGYRVIIHYRHSAEEARALADRLNRQRPDSALTAAADLGRPADLAELARISSTHWGGLDALINNASDFYPTPVEQASEADWQRLMASNLKGPFFLIQALLPALRARRGCVLNMVDIHAERPLADHPIYCAAKAGLVALTRALARDLGPDIRVNGIAPGAILWPEDEGGDSAFTAAEKQRLQQLPAGRIGQPEDLAHTALFLLRQAPYITGQILAVDGGRSLI